MANQLLLGRALDANGYILPGAKCTVYAAGTSTLIAIYSDVDGTVAADNPFAADGNGFWPQRYVDVDAKAVVTDADDVALYTLDPCPTAQGTGAAASQISFAPTVDVPENNVQDAIERVSANVISGFATFGIGVTGNATLLANIDATTTGAGVYRFDGTSTGTYPTGVSAADTGLIEYWRQSSTVAFQNLYHSTSARVFSRRMTASVWGAWREDINVPVGAAQGNLIFRNATEWARLAIGTAGQVLQVNSGATAPEWAALSGGIGYGQTWQNVESSRLGNTSYQNTTGKPIMVFITTNQTGGFPQVSVDNSTWVNVGRFDAGTTFNAQFIVPNNHYYRLNIAKGSVTFWTELR